MTQALSQVVGRQVDRLRAGASLPNPLPPPMASALRSMVTAAECAALAGIEPEHFDQMLALARRAHSEKLQAGVVG